MLNTTIDAIPEREILLCPICRFEYVHPVKVKVATGSRIFVIDSQGLETIVGETAETLEAKRERGARIILEYQCESGHHGNLVFQFHKGNTFIEHETLPSQKEWSTLWRT